MHGAGPNLTAGRRRAMTWQMMPAHENRFNGKQNVLSEAQVAKLRIGDPLDDPTQNPLLYVNATGGPP